MNNTFAKTAQITEKLPGYWAVNSHGLNNQSLKELSIAYRTKFLKSFEFCQENKLPALNFNAGFGSTKKDGIGSFFYWERGSGHITFQAPGMGVEIGLPCTDELAQALEKTEHQNAFVYGEIYIEGSRSRCNEVLHRIWNPSNRQEIEELSFQVIDALVINKKDILSKPYSERINEVKGLGAGIKWHPSDFVGLASKNELTKFFDTVKGKGEEGVVVHNTHSGSTIKIKPLLNLDLAILGYIEGTAEMSGKVVSLVGGLKTAEGTWNYIARVGGISPTEGATLLAMLQPLALPSNHIEADSDHRLVKWVKPAVTMEINGEETTFLDTDNSAWNSPSFEVTDKLGYIGERASAKVIHPVFHRLRPDKETSECTTKQIDNFPAFNPKQTAQANVAGRITSHVIIAKGKTAVKKITVIQREISPVYTVVTTDFSAGRAEELKVTTAVTDFSEEVTRAIADWKTDEIKKGWAIVSQIDEAAASTQQAA